MKGKDGGMGDMEGGRGGSICGRKSNVGRWERIEPESGRRREGRIEEGKEMREREKSEIRYVEEEKGKRRRE